MQVWRILRSVSNGLQKINIGNLSRCTTVPRETQFWKPCMWQISLLSSKQGRLCSTLPAVCWKCGEKSNSIMFCKQCDALQRPNKNVNYFNLFNLVPSYDVEITNLSKQYRKLQSILHPDKYASASENERKISEEYSSIVNKAYNTLQQPLARGLYMLELQAIHLEEGNVQSNPDFLMELMQRNEEVDEAKNEEEVRNVSEKNKKMLEDLIKKASAAFGVGNLKEAKEILIKMKYFYSIEAKIKVLKINKGIVE